MNAESPLAIPDYRRFLATRFTAQCAQTIMVVVIGWQVYDIARRTMEPKQAALQLGLIGLVQFIPMLLLTLPAGYLADRLDRRLIGATTAFLESGCAIFLLVQTATDALTLPQLFVVAGLLGVERAIASPAIQSLGPSLVPAAILPKSIAYNSLGWQTAVIVSPPLGGFLYAAGPAWPYAVSAVLFAVAMFGLLSITPAAPTKRTPMSAALQEIIEGLRYVRSNRIVLGAISLDLFAVLLGGATAMLPIFARDILHAGPSGLGWLRAAPSVGAAVVGIILARKPVHRHVGVKLLCGVALFGLATVAFGLSRNLFLSLGILVVLGGADMFSVYVRQSLVQLSTPDRMRGRVNAVSGLFISASNELGEFESGVLASVISPATAVVAGGIGAVFVALLWARLFPQLRKIHDLRPPEHPVTPQPAPELVEKPT